MIDQNRLRALLQPLLSHLTFFLPAGSGDRTVWIPIQEGTGLGVFQQFRSGEEAWKLGLFQTLLGLSEGMFVDVGVNLGQTLIQLRQVDHDRPYLGFEPNPDCLHYVYALIRRNGYAHVDLLAAGLGETTGVLSLYLPPGRSTDSTATLLKDLRPDRRYEARHVPIFNEGQLRGLLGGRKLGVVKVDVEGAEPEVFKGIRGLLDRDRPPVLCEVLYTDPKGDVDASAARNAELLALLKGIGYRVLQIRKSADHARIEALAAVDAFPRGYHEGDNVGLADYLFLPAEQAEAWSRRLL
jgi:FkbM family methyltransferase